MYIVCRNASSHMTLAVSGERVYIECVGMLLSSHMTLAVSGERV